MIERVLRLLSMNDALSTLGKRQSSIASKRDKYFVIYPSAKFHLKVEAEATFLVKSRSFHKQRIPFIMENGANKIACCMRVRVVTELSKA